MGVSTMGAGKPFRSRHGFARACVALGLAAASGSAGAGPFDVIRNLPAVIPGGLPSALPPKPATPAPGAPAAPGASGAPALMATAPTQQAPLHRLGTDAVALVETATPGAPVQVMDYVFAKQSFKLAPKGKVTLSYLTGCLSETFTGGVVTVGLKEATVSGGAKTQALRAGCKAPNPIILASASEAGATVNRITPFSGVVWDERALHSSAPVFKWDKALGATTLLVKDMDKTGEPVVWQAAVAKDWIAYPATAAHLTPGMPYKAEVMAGDRVVAEALFSFDPALDESDSMASRVVPLNNP